MNLDMPWVLEFFGIKIILEWIVAIVLQRSVELSLTQRERLAATNTATGEL